MTKREWLKAAAVGLVGATGLGKLAGLVTEDRKFGYGLLSPGRPVRLAGVHAGGGIVAEPGRFRRGMERARLATFRPYAKPMEVGWQGWYESEHAGAYGTTVVGFLSLDGEYVPYEGQDLEMETIPDGEENGWAKFRPGRLHLREGGEHA